MLGSPSESANVKSFGHVESVAKCTKTNGIQRKLLVAGELDYAVSVNLNTSDRLIIMKQQACCKN